MKGLWRKEIENRKFRRKCERKEKSNEQASKSENLSRDFLNNPVEGLNLKEKRLEIKSEGGNKIFSSCF